MLPADASILIASECRPVDRLVIRRGFGLDVGPGALPPMWPARLCRSLNREWKRAPAAGFPAPGGSDWHVKCLGIIGLSRPGTFSGRPRRLPFLYLSHHQLKRELNDEV